jgi:hypothetical protein
VKAVQVDVIAYAPTAFFHCRHCEITFQQMGIGARMRRIEAAESLPPDLQREYADLSDWIHHLRDRHGDDVAVRVIDAMSLPGVWTSLRYRVRSYPAVRVGRGRWVRPDEPTLDAVIDSLVAAGRAIDGGGSRRRTE